ncbi:hypothetical protein [Enterovibrio norvegicus]|uniref:hypothetical protein n=1 Tax=Enterovibrio norvegicus TaxID=188144 RepID=UPI000C853D8D|nr:hypothetical protein [Enterovibrio norvegicus]PMH64495.1 hypothetical protein BCU62_15690 [Enterovibrio norvegicus]
MAKRKKKYINASDIGAVSFCEMSLYNKQAGVKSSRINQGHIRRGNIAHDELNAAIRAEAKSQFWLLRFIRYIFRVLFK